MFPDYAALEAENAFDAPGGGHYPATRPTFIYDGEDQGKPNRPAQSWDGYTAATGAEAEARRRCARREAGDTGEITDGEADTLFPPRTAAEARHRAREVQAGRVLDYDESELNSLLAISNPLNAFPAIAW